MHVKGCRHVKMYQVVCFVIDIIVCSYLIFKENCMFMKDSIITVELDNQDHDVL